MKIDKAYRPELVVSKGKEPNPLLTDPYLDAREDRLVSMSGPALVALPVETEKGERSRYLACSLLEAARGLGDPELPAEIEEQEIVEYGVLWPTAQERTFPDWKKLVPSFKRGSAGTVTFALDAGLLHQVAKAMGVGGVCLTIELGRPAEHPSPVIVQPLNPAAEELGLLMPMDARGAGEPVLAPGQVCPVCRKVLAAGAFCPDHGDPRAADGAARTTREVMEDIHAELDKRKAAKGATAAALEWTDIYGGGIEADLPDGGSFRIAEKGDGFALARVKPGKKGFTNLGQFDTETEAKKAAARAAAEGAADALLENAGDGKLTKADTKGPAAARKKGGRR